MSCSQTGFLTFTLSEQSKRSTGCSALLTAAPERHRSIGPSPATAANAWGDSTYYSLVMLGVWLLGLEHWFHSHSSCTSRAWRRNGKNRSGLLVLPQKPTTLCNNNNNKHSNCVSGKHEVGYKVWIIYSDHWNISSSLRQVYFVFDFLFPNLAGGAGLGYAGWPMLLLFSFNYTWILPFPLPI